MENAFGHFYSQRVTNQNELTLKLSYLILGNVCKSSDFNVDIASERNDFRFCIKRKVIQVKCAMKEKIWE